MPSLNSHLTISQSRDLTLMAVGKGTEQRFGAALSKGCLTELQADLKIMRVFSCQGFFSFLWTTDFLKKLGILFGCSRGGPHACRWTLLLRRINRKWQSSCVNMSYSTCLLWAVAEGKPPLESSQAPPAALSNPRPLPLTPSFMQCLAFILMEPNEHSHP